MISALVLAPDLVVGEETGRASELVVRSLAWLVSAVVAGVVRDVTLSAPAGRGLGGIADQAGCELVQSESEHDRLVAGIARARGPLLLVIKSGYQPQSGFIEELDDLIRHEAAARALILAAPSVLAERLFPDLAPTIGLVAPLDACRDIRGGFRGLAQSLKGAARLRHRATAISEV